MLPIHQHLSNLHFCFFLLFIANCTRSLSCRLAQPVTQPMTMYMKLQSLGFPPARQRRFLLSTLLHLVVSTFFIRLVPSLGATYYSVKVKQLPWVPIHICRALSLECSLPSDMHVARVRYQKQDITLNMLENQAASKEQSSTKELYQPDMERVRLVNRRRNRSAFAANQKSVSQAQTFVSFNAFGGANYFQSLICGFSGPMDFCL